MIMRRRRPLLRAAMVGGGAYYAGKKMRQGREQTAEREAAGTTPAAGISDETIDQLQKLSDLKAKGVLTQDEFDQQKQKLLQPA
jgi:putative oligomerization/nucleic acid binding protein